MTPSSRPSANRPGAGLVVMGCAGEDAESLRDALEALRQDGLEVELCDGLDHDPKRLSELIERHDGRGLYVLCRSPRLGRERVEELREILLARHIPFARTLTVAVGGRGALADRIRSGLRRASARSSGPNQVASSTGTPQLVSTGRSRPVRTTHATEDEEPTLVGKRETGELDMSEPEPSIPRPAPPAPAPAAPESSPPRAEISVIEAIDEDLLTEDTSASQSGAAIVSADLDLSDLDQGNTGARRAPLPDITSVGPAPAMITGNTVVGPAPTMLTGDTVVGERLPPALREAAGRWPLSTAPVRSPAPSSELELEPSTMPLPRLRPSGPFPAPPPSPVSSSPDPSAWPSASMSGPTSPAASGAPSFSAPGTSASDLGSSVEPAARSKALPWALGGVALLLLALVIALAVSSEPSTPEVASSDAATADDAASASPSPADAPPAEDTKADATPKAPPVYPVVTALRSRQVRALDVLLIATAHGKPSDYPAAAAYCDGLEIEGLGGWRLPRIGELSSMAAANMIARGMYWSSTAADTFGDDHMAWNVRRGHASPYGEQAVAVCVRGEAVTGS